MAGALILTIIPVLLIVVSLLLTTGALSPLAAIGFGLLMGLVGLVFVGLMRSARRMQPSRNRGDSTRSEDASESPELSTDHRAREGLESNTAGWSRDAENAIARWDNEGGSARP